MEVIILWYLPLMMELHLSTSCQIYQIIFVVGMTINDFFLVIQLNLALYVSMALIIHVTLGGNGTVVPKINDFVIPTYWLILYQNVMHAMPSTVIA